jgi:hypothetical protein
MEEQAFDAHFGRAVAIDICFSCQVFWFDARESISLTPGATLALFRVMGDRIARAGVTHADTARCPRCRAQLRRTSDMQRATRFEYWRCPHDHGRLTTFFNFLREKDFIRPLTPRQIAELRSHVQAVNCSNCGAAVDVTAGSACAHCGSALSMLDLPQAERLIAQLQQAEARAREARQGRPDTAGRPDSTGSSRGVATRHPGNRTPIDPALPLELARARREVEAAFSDHPSVSSWLRDAPSGDLVGASLIAMAKWLSRDV